MNLGQLLSTARTLLRDRLTPYLWADDILIEFANDAVMEACIRARLLESTPQVSVVANVDAYTIPYEVQKLVQVQFIDQATDATAAGSFIPGKWYTIVTPGTTDFTLIGADNSTAGTAFIATGVGAGTGTAKLGTSSLVSIVGQPELLGFKSGYRAASEYLYSEDAQPRPLIIAQGESNNEVSIYPTPSVAGTLVIRLRRLPLSTEVMTDISHTPVIPETFHRGLVDWVLAQAYAVDVSDTRSDRQSERYESKFEARFGRRPTARGEAAGRRYIVGSDVYPRTFGG